MQSFEILGYLASGAVFMTFWMKTMIPLRVIAIASNVLFIFYAAHAELLPILLLHGALLPLNCFRLSQAISLKRRLHRMAHTAFDVKALLPFMTEHRVKAGKFLFQRGDTAAHVYYIAEGRARIVELGININAGEMLGEIAVFSPDRLRTQSARAETDCVLFSISEEKIFELYAENREFGLFLIKMIVARLLTNATSPATKSVAGQTTPVPGAAAQ